jgi:hypothetical protein
MPVTFEVSQVEPGTLRLDTIPVVEAIHRLTSVARQSMSKQRLEVTYPPMRGYEGSSTVDGGVFAANLHPFVAAVQFAFDAHLPLSLSPDHVWIVLAQGFANHLQLHAEHLRERFVAHQGKLVLNVQRDDFVRGRPNPWPELIEQFTTEIRQHLGKRCELVIADFSTTGPLERTVSQMVLLDAMRGYFEYAFYTLCGIPRLTLTGTPADWRSIRTRAEVFAEFELGWWIDALRPILDGFVAAAEGQIDTAHWCSMYKRNNGSGGPYIAGWLSLLFPYLCHHRRDSVPELIRNPYLQGWRERLLKDDDLGGGPTTNQFPAALSSAPLRWNYLEEIIDLEMLAGFAGVRQDPATLELTPQLGWAIRERQ